jgi:mannose/fructose/N-acetylgalactosamine-specific phosphotransferase system component IIB
MSKTYVRIDDRLIHGQIVTAWCITLGIQEIIAIDDALASNVVMQSIMTMGVPEQYHPKIVTAAKAKELLSIQTDRTRLVITRFCKNMAQIREEIKGAEHINIGNCSKQPDSKYNIRGIGISHVFSFTQEDVDALDALEADGGKVICQALPSDKLKTWSDLKKQF